MDTQTPDVSAPSLRRGFSLKLLGSAIASLFLGGAALHAQTIGGTSSLLATDNAGNYSAFGSASSTPANGGSGWGAWNFSSNSTTNTSFCGEFLGGAANGGINSGNGNSWGIYANTSNTASVYRGFGFDIIGDTISAEIQTPNGVPNGETVGWSLWNGSSTNMTEFYFVGGSSDWINPNAAGTTQNQVGFSFQTIQTDLTITSATTFSLTATISGGSSMTTTGAFTNSTNATGIGDLFRFFDFNTGSSSNAYFNNEKVLMPTFDGSGNFSTGTWAANGQLANTPINGANVAFGGTATASATNNSITTVNSYTFNSGAGAYTVAGNNITLGDVGSDNAGIYNNSSNTQTVNENLTLGSGAAGTTVGATISAASGALVLGGTLNLNGSRVLVNGANTTTISGVVTGSANILMQNNSGTLVINNPNNNFGPNVSGSGNLFIDGGTVLVGASGALGSTDGATTGYANLGTTVASQDGNNSAVLLTAGGVTIANPIDIRFVSGVTYGTQQIGGTNLSGTATFSGPIALHNSVTISATSGGIVAVNGAIAQGSTNGVFSAETINGTPGVTVKGNGTVVLAGNDTYSGATAINGGVAIVSGSLAGTSATTVAAGATLEVDGLVNNSTTVSGSGVIQGNGTMGGITANGGEIAPGLTVANSTSATGILTAGNVTLSGSTTFAIRIGVGSATASDELSSSGSVNLNGATLALTLGGLVNNPANIGKVYDIVSGATALSGTFAGLANGSPVTVNGFEFTVNYDVTANGTGSGNFDTLTLEQVPEPGAWAGILSGVAFLAAFRRRRR